MQSFAALMIRSLVYLLFMAGVANIFAMEGYALLAESKYDEGSATELMHDTFAFVTCMLFLIGAYYSDTLRPAAVVVATLSGMMLIREFDAFLDENMFDGAWQTLVCILIATSTLYLIRQHHPVKPSLIEFSKLSSAGIYLSGILVVLVFSRLFGRGSFWEAVMGDGYVRVVKNIVEEGTELMGYTILVIAAVEFLWQIVSQRRASNASR
ncbi:hypothetical protein [Neptuniibacter sp. QD34_54]|uniref:hypothetical protein n=1 Tax=unclassified Neptuniibacter TaxID=2630693 RepID=UPI0039F7015E